jgi:xanthine dehydrogenase accessory factor
MSLIEFCNKVVELKKSHDPFIIITLVNRRGSCPQDIGARAIANNNGLLYGTVGGGKIEHHCLEYSKQLLKDKNPENICFVKSWNLQRDIKMTCGGEVTIMFEVSHSTLEWNIAIFGAGHVSQELNILLSRLNCNITTLDHRSEWLAKVPEHEQLKKILDSNPKSHLDHLYKNTFLIIMTMGNSTDYPILKKALLEFDFPYIGVIGSSTKSQRLKYKLADDNVPAELIDKFICPIGEPIGSNEPCEIAVSIVSQLLKKKDLFFKASKRY